MPDFDARAFLAELIPDNPPFLGLFFSWPGFLADRSFIGRCVALFYFSIFFKSVAVLHFFHVAVLHFPVRSATGFLGGEGAD